MAQQRTAYGARVAAQVHKACPRFPAGIMDLILKLAVGKQNYNIYAPSPALLPEFDFLYSKRDSVTKEVDIFDDTVIGTFGGRELSRSRADAFFEGLDAISRPSLVGINGQAVRDESIRKSREILADQIDLKPDIHSKIVSEIEGLVRTMGHPNKFEGKLQKLLIFKQGDFNKDDIDDWPQGSDEKNAIFTVLVPFLGTGALGQTDVVTRLDSCSSIILYNHHKVGYHIFPHSRFLALVFQVFDTGVRNPEARCATRPADAFSMVLAKGFNKVAIQSAAGYDEDKRINKEHQLRGADKMFAEHARASGAKRIEVCELYIDETQRMFRPEILDIVKTNEAFARHFGDTTDEGKNEDEDENEEEEENVQTANDEEEQVGEVLSSGVKRSRAVLNEGEEEVSSNAAKRARSEREVVEEQKEKQKQKEAEAEEYRLFFDRGELEDSIDFSPNFDMTGAQTAVRDQHRLGDTLVLSGLAANDRNVAGFHKLDIYATLTIIAHF